MRSLPAFALFGLLTSCSLLACKADESLQESKPAALVETEIDGLKLSHPAGFRVSKVASAPLVKWPICADVGRDGRLYIAESSGSNAPVQQQLQERTHRIVVLEDRDRDGRYDHRQVFAEKMMFPEGILCIDRGVLVCAPPQIWKLQDLDGDGTAEVREVWFDAKTLTGCANDLHGPYRGPDGLIYWCKGAFAEQTHQLADGRQLVTKASHIFRRPLLGGELESVMTGGMDNPVEVAFDQVGNVFFTSTFVQHPAGGFRDGLMHAVYGGVYGKDHNVIDGHPKTGDLMPIMTHLGPAAPAGVMRVESDLLETPIADTLLVAHFNLQKISMHQLEAAGGGFKTIDSDFLRGDRLEFHPTDILHDADGSLLAIDTGGWYRLCCPTSHLDQSVAEGGIYRIERADRSIDRNTDWTGKSIQWEKVDSAEAIKLVGDTRMLVRLAAQDRLVALGNDAVKAIGKAMDDRQLNPQHRVLLLWVLSRIATADAQQVVREQINRDEPQVRQVALQIMSTLRSVDPQVRGFADGEIASPHELRLSLQWLGRVLAVKKGPDLEQAIKMLQSVPDVSSDRILEHALIYSVIESGDTELAVSLTESATNKAAFCKALHAMDPEKLKFEKIAGLLNTTQQPEKVREYSRAVALWLIQRSSGWDVEIAGRLEELLRTSQQSSDTDFQRMIALSFSRPSLSHSLAGILSGENNPELKVRILDSVGNLPAADLSEVWVRTLLESLARAKDIDGIQRTLRILAKNKYAEALKPVVTEALQETLQKATSDETLRCQILAAFPAGMNVLADGDFKLVSSRLLSNFAPSERAVAIECLQRSKLSEEQLLVLAKQVDQLGPMELSRVLTLLEGCHSPIVNEQLVSALEKSAVTQSMPGDRFQRHFANHPAEIRDPALMRLAKLTDSTLEQRKQRLDDVLSKLGPGDPLRGFQIFHGTKASCGACHEIGYRGGNVGPDLSRIGSIRSRRDLVEAILYPSVSFVRSYEPVAVMTVDGEVVSGLMVEETVDAVTVIQAADQRVRIKRSDIEEIRPGKTSVMPAGLEQTLSLEELADLIALLESSK